MNEDTPRRTFLKSAGLGLTVAPAVLSQRKPNDAVRLGFIGVGTRGFYLLRQFKDVAGAETRIICDLYDGHIERAKALVKDANPRITKDWQAVVNAPDIDAVVIAAPDFWHAPMVLAAAKAKKDIYVEKAWCMTVEQAKQMRAAIRQNKIVMQLGHNRNSNPNFQKAREIFRAGQLGKVPLARLFIDRTAAIPQWKFYGDYNIHDLPADASPSTIDWERFVANTSKRPFDAERFFRWRNWWEYGTGIAGDLMSHLWDTTNLILGMGIPETCATQGGVYFWKADQEVPDMWNVLLDYPKQELAITFGSNFHNEHYGDVVQLLGRDGTAEVSTTYCRVYEPEWRPGYAQKLKEARKIGGPGAFPLIYSLKPGDSPVTSHYQNFIDCMRTREKPRCHEDRAFEEAVTVIMSVQSYREDRKVRWDAAKEQIV